jgi:hypothetical protein
MNLLNQFSVFAESRGEGLHPKLRALLELAAAAPLSEFSVHHDGMVQAGPSPESEAVSSRSNVVLFSREPARPVVAASKSEMRRPSTASLQREPV